MSLTYPTTDDTPTPVAIMPDWRYGIRTTIGYQTDITESRRGIEQRSQRRRRPRLTMEYRTNIDDAAAALRLETILATARGPLHVPWWPSGIPLATEMPDWQHLTLETLPLDDDWSRIPMVLIWSRGLGTQWRNVASRDGVDIALEADSVTHIRYPAGSFVFPIRLAVRDVNDGLLISPTTSAAQDMLYFRTL